MYWRRPIVTSSADKFYDHVIQFSNITVDGAVRLLVRRWLSDQRTHEQQSELWRENCTGLAMETHECGLLPCPSVWTRHLIRFVIHNAHTDTHIYIYLKHKYEA